MAASITVFFIYTCELLPTPLRYGVWWAEGKEGNGRVPRLSICQKTVALLNTVCMGWLTYLLSENKTQMLSFIDLLPLTKPKTGKAPVVSVMPSG